jgi:hypothetical protein
MAGYTLEERRATCKRFKYVRLTAQEGWSSCLLCPALSVLAGPSAMQRLLHLILPFSTDVYLGVTSARGVTPSTQSNLFPKLICFFYLETHKVSTSIRGGFHILLHKTFLEQVHSARLSCTADTRPLNEFEKGPNLAENRVEYVLLTT